ncbi:GGDEF domain-containing protein [uncultured Photobacterium sp.]|uniref:GGDEF domain-containing protein n=1 Tax=uncultured Photobacterium sp. TaxID=173973 RepID=UPI00262288E5|nr:GGDEF domain-containing protein [uncultured Photobacterium sp.]
MTKLTRRIRLAVYTLIIVTVSSYLCYLSGVFDTELVISSKLTSFKSIDDSDYDGSTKSWLDYDGHSLTLECNITDVARWPFCGVSIMLSNDSMGVDLSKYHSIGLELDYKSPPFSERIRVYLRNFDPAYSDLRDPLSLKYNSIEFSPGMGSGLSVIPMQAFQVLSWWIADYEIPIEESGQQVNNVIEIQVSTAGKIIPANYKLKIKSLVFYGKWISEASLLKFNVLMWLAAAGAFLLLEYFRLQGNLKSVEARRNELRTTNRALFERTRRFEELAYRDALTGTKNRNAVSAWLEEAIEDAIIHGSAFSLIYLDIDHFKSINDRYGHLKGDEILKAFAKLLESQICESNVFVRWGGEEFIIFCPGESLSYAEPFAQHLRAVVESNQWTDDLPVTCSIGVAELTGDESFESLLDRADSALYAAKQGGRNRVEVKSVRLEYINKRISSLV